MVIELAQQATIYFTNTAQNVYICCVCWRNSI